jgi:hypothetical protein
MDSPANFAHRGKAVRLRLNLFQEEEDSRVKIPCVLHLVRFGYRCLSLKSAD